MILDWYFVGVIRKVIDTEASGISVSVTVSLGTSQDKGLLPGSL